MPLFSIVNGQRNKIHPTHCEGHIVHGKEKQCPRVAKLWSVQWSLMEDFAKTSANAIIVMYFLV